MNIAPTSLAAYADLRSSLNHREGIVLQALAAYRDRYGAWPTSYELFAFMQQRGEAQDLNGCRPRLSSLFEKGLVEHPVVKQRCSITGKRAFTWRIVQPDRMF